MTQFQTQNRTSALEDAAKLCGHPDPKNARWGEVNVLSIHSERKGAPLSPAEAERILHIAEFDADFNTSLWES